MSDDDVPHLRQMDEAIVVDLCERAAKLSCYNYTIRKEIQGFLESRSPWDATRLANALALTNPVDPDVQGLVRELDAAAEACAGAVPANRMTRRQ